MSYISILNSKSYVKVTVRVYRKIKLIRRYLLKLPYVHLYSKDFYNELFF